MERGTRTAVSPDGIKKKPIDWLIHWCSFRYLVIHADLIVFYSFKCFYLIVSCTAFYSWSRNSGTSGLHLLKYHWETNQQISSQACDRSIFILIGLSAVVGRWLRFSCVHDICALRVLLHLDQLFSVQRDSSTAPSSATTASRPTDQAVELTTTRRTSDSTTSVAGAQLPSTGISPTL